MSVNFCRPELQPKISTSSVCSDGYGVDNLLTFNPFRGGWKGFIAESFIKPPLDILIEFPINICIEKIVLDPTVGRQKSSGFEIYSATVPANQRNKDDSQKNQAPIFTKIGNSLIPWASIGQNPCMLTFRNTAYKPSFPDISRLSPQKQDMRGVGNVERFLRCAAPGSVENVNRLTIRIFRTFEGSVIVLRRLEVWGEPSMRIPRQSQLWALEIIQKLFTRTDLSKREHVPSEPESSNNMLTGHHHSNGHSSSNNVADKEEGTECPEDFLDPITCQMMMLPVLLPSGHTIDRSTLDKHNKTEAIWGRPPNDPFTGVKFTSKSQPIPNVKLKTRIDRFLLTCSDKDKPVARDVGRASIADNSSKPTASTLIMPSIQPAGAIQSRHSLPVASLGSATKSRLIAKPTSGLSKSNKVVKTSLSAKSRTTAPATVSGTSRSSEVVKTIHPANSRTIAAATSSGTLRSSEAVKQSLSANSRTVTPATSSVILSKSSEVVNTSLPSRQKRVLAAGRKEASLKKARLSGPYGVGDGCLQSLMKPFGRTLNPDVLKSHEDSVTDSLDDALNQALGGLPSYSSTSAPSQSLSIGSNDLTHTLSTVSALMPACAVCHAEMKSAALNVDSKPAVMLYRLPCTHLICRACLVTSTDKHGALNSQQDTRFCASCGRSYRREDVVRVHL